MNGNDNKPAAQPAAAQEAVAGFGRIHDRGPLDLALADYEREAFNHGRTGENAIAVDAAAERVWAVLKAAAPVAAAPDMVNEADFLDIPSHPDFDPPVICESTPAAPGIDLEQFRPLIKLGITWGPGSRYRIAAESLAAKIAASPKGGEPVATLTIGDAGEEGTQAYFLDRIRDTEAFGKLPPGTYQLAVCSLQATSAEVGE